MGIDVHSVTLSVNRQRILHNQHIVLFYQYKPHIYIPLHFQYERRTQLNRLVTKSTLVNHNSMNTSNQCNACDT